MVKKIGCLMIACLSLLIQPNQMCASALAILLTNSNHLPSFIS